MINNLLWEDSEAYWQAITIIEAQGLLMDMRIADYPNMKPADRGRYHKTIHQQAYPKTWDQSDPVSTKEAYLKLKAALHGR